MVEQPGRRIEYVPIDDIAPAPRNPKTHDVAAIRASVSRFGAVSPAVRDERTGLLVVGHGRTEALREMRDAGESPPSGVCLGPAGVWLVPVLAGWASRSDAEAEAYLVADNRHTELGGWDDGGLAEVLSELAAFDPALLEVAGYSQGDLEVLLAELDSVTELPPVLGDPDDVPGVPVKTRSLLGDVWLLGQHRLLVGDATDMASVEAMLGGDRADCMWTDPPYGVEYVGKTKDALTISNDGALGLADLLAGAFAVATVALNPGAAVYIAHPPGGLAYDFTTAFLTAGWLFRQNLVWVKDVLVLGHSDYQYRHEPILFGYTDGSTGRRGRGGDGWYGDHSQTTVFEVPKPQRSIDHPTMKPVELIRQMLANSCPPGGLVYEPFAGSGSVLVAAQMLGMRVAAVEVDPKYADVICRRLQETTGEKPILASTGEPVDFCQGNDGD